jgi:steroid 3-oxidase
MQVISEALRLGNIINGIMRKAVRDVEVRGHLIPKGWRVLLYFRGMHLDAGVHDDPHAFNPWRWKDRADAATSTFTPFGGGQRLCPGMDLARLEASIFLHHMVTSFRYVTFLHPWNRQLCTVIFICSMLRNAPTVGWPRRTPSSTFLRCG